jgi:uncharacterized membrane protein YkoI
MTMSRTRLLLAGLVVLIGSGLVGCTMSVKEPLSKPALLEAVEKAFKAEFPKGDIVKAEEEEENGVTVYDIEFKEGGVHREADIAADGTILKVAIEVEAKQVPEAAMKGIQKAAEGATIAKIEKEEARYETKDGKIIKLDKPKLTFEVELKKGDQTGELVVDEKGTVVEAPKWEKDKDDE